MPEQDYAEKPPRSRTGGSVRKGHQAEEALRILGKTEIYVGELKGG